MWFQPLKLIPCGACSQFHVSQTTRCCASLEEVMRRSLPVSFAAPQKAQNKENTAAKTRVCVGSPGAPHAYGGEPTTSLHMVPIGCGAERLIGVRRRRGRRSRRLHQTSRILSLGRNVVVERSLAEPPCRSTGAEGGTAGGGWARKMENKPAGSLKLIGGEWAAPPGKLLWRGHGGVASRVWCVFGFMRKNACFGRKFGTAAASRSSETLFETLSQSQVTTFSELACLHSISVNQTAYTWHQIMKIRVQTGKGRRNQWMGRRLSFTNRREQPRLPSTGYSGIPEDTRSL